MKVEIKPIIEALKHDANQLERHARKLRATPPNLRKPGGATPVAKRQSAEGSVSQT